MPIEALMGSFSSTQNNHAAAEIITTSYGLVLELGAQTLLIGRGDVTAPYKSQVKPISARRPN
jgi:hypothetical protein